MLSILLEKAREHRFLLFLVLAGCLLYAIFFASTATVSLNIDVEKRTVFRMYWAKSDQGFSEDRVAKLVVTPNKKKYTFLLTNIKKIKKLRIDPHQYKGLSKIRSLSLSQKGVQTIHFTGSDLFSRFKPNEHVEQYQLKDSSVVVESKGRDPFIIGDITFDKTNYPWLAESCRYLFICLVISLVYGATRHLVGQQQYVVILMSVVLTCILVMALISKRNVHPDEYVHIYASRYYQQHWMPPQIEDPSISHTYSQYGASRLNNSEISYLFAGKFAQLVSFFKMRPYWLFRLFNVFLFGCILLYTIRVVDARSVALPLLISPQIWYVFSYCNSDAFALFVTFVVGVQLVVPDSHFNRFIRQKDPGRIVWKGVLLGCLLGCLLLLKKNYYPYIVFILTYLAWQIYQEKDRQERLLMLKRLAVLSMIGLCLFGLRRGADYYVNGVDRAEKLAKIRVEKARKIFNPKTELEKTHASLYLKKKGVPLSYVVHTKRFFEQTFRSSFGVYGYFTISGPFRYYDCVRWIGCALLLFFLCKVLFYSWRENGIIVLSFLVFSVLLIGFSLYHSWAKDFQAQGRYLFPIVSMLSIVYAKTSKYCIDKLFYLLFFILFLLSGYSFIFIALSKIPKTIL